VTLDHIGSAPDSCQNIYIRAAGGSEGYGIGGTIGVKLAAPDKPVIGLVGDGSMFYADSGMWTASNHNIPVLYVISNNQSYGIVAGRFGSVEGVMKQSGEYAGVVLEGIDPVKIAEGFGLEGLCVSEESELEKAINRGMDVVTKEGRPFLLDVRLPLGVPQGGRAATPFRLSAVSKAK
jgi:benzoylformate decarboxylase